MKRMNEYKTVYEAPRMQVILFCSDVIASSGDSFFGEDDPLDYAK